jgi:hypothetical protein
MKNIAGMMKQAQQMKKNMERVQGELEQFEAEGSAGGEMVTVLMTGKNEVRRVKINPEAVDDIETLEDLVAAAVNDAQNKVQTHVDAEMAKVTGGMNIPGM